MAKKTPPKKTSPRVTEVKLDSDDASGEPPVPPDQGLIIVGIGASAGGQEAFEKFFAHTPGDSGLAFVVVQHLDPTHKSILVELLQRYTPLQVLQAHHRHSRPLSSPGPEAPDLLPVPATRLIPTDP